MRFDTQVYFQAVTKGEYNAKTGDYATSEVKECEKWADVTFTDVKMLPLIYGGVREGSLTVRLQRPYTEPFSRIRIGEKLYKVDSEIPLRNKSVFIVSEVQ